MRAASSPPTVRSRSSVQYRSRSSFNPGNSASANSRISGSAAAAISIASRIWVFSSLETAVLQGQLAKRSVLAVDRRHPRGIGQHVGIRQQLLQLLETPQFFVKLFAHHPSPASSTDGAAVGNVGYALA